MLVSTPIIDGKRAERLGMGSAGWDGLDGRQGGVCGIPCLFVMPCCWVYIPDAVTGQTLDGMGCNGKRRIA